MRRLLVLLLLLAAQAHAADPAPAAPTAIVNIDNFSFAPAILTVRAGTRVTWNNRDDIPHVVVGAGADRLIKSPPLDTDDSFSFSFDKPGAYPYFCSLHPHMQGKIIVE